MPTDRDLAQQWLAERLTAVEEDAWKSLLTSPLDPARFSSASLVAAILDTPGVIVYAELGAAVGGYIRVPEDEDPYTHRQLVIRLPAEPLSAQRSGVAAHQQDRTEEQG